MRDGVVVDIGAFAGGFSGWALRHGAERVIAFEPDPTNVECLRRNYPDDVAAGRLTIVPRGLWDGPTSLPFTGHGDSTRVAESGVEGDVTMDVIDLGSALAQLDVTRVTCIKMDAEGADLHIPSGAREVVAAHTPTMWLYVCYGEDDWRRMPQILDRQTRGRYRIFCRGLVKVQGRYRPALQVSAPRRLIAILCRTP